MRKLSLILIVLLLSLSLTACGSSTSNSADVVKIGSIHPLTGALAMEGQEMRDAIQMAVDEVNEAGGIRSLGGAKVELVAADHEGKPEKGVSEVQRLVREGVIGIVGPYMSGVALAATQEAERQRIPFVIDIASADNITERGFRYTFRIQPPASSMAENFLKYFKELNGSLDKPLTTAVIVYEDSIFGSSIAKVIGDRAGEVGLKVLGKIAHPANTADLSSDVNKIKSLKPDVVIATTYLSDGTLLVKGMKQAGYQPKAIIGVANGAFSNAKFIKEEIEINQYILDVNYTINPKSERIAKIKELYRKKYNKNLSPNAAYAYEAAKVLLNAIEKAGSTDRTKIRDAIAKTYYKDHILPQGPIVFDDKGQNKNAQAVVNQIVEGKSVVVFPNEYKERDPVFPMQ